MSGHPAQPDNLAIDRAASILRASAAVLLTQADVLQTTPKRQVRMALKRMLSGVLADVEMVRQAVKD